MLLLPAGEKPFRPVAFATARLVPLRHRSGQTGQPESGQNQPVSSLVLYTICRCNAREFRMLPSPHGKSELWETEAGPTPILPAHSYGRSHGMTRSDGTAWDFARGASAPGTREYVIASGAKQSPTRRIEIASSLRSSQ